jgi:hypothetical protein
MIQPIQVLIFQDSNGIFIAQCLEYDYCSQGNTFEEAEQAFLEGLRGQIMLDLEFGASHGLRQFSPSPKIFWAEPAYRSGILKHYKVNLITGDINADS